MATTEMQQLYSPIDTLAKEFAPLLDVGNSGGIGELHPLGNLVWPYVDVVDPISQHISEHTAGGTLGQNGEYANAFLRLVDPASSFMTPVASSVTKTFEVTQASSSAQIFSPGSTLNPHLTYLGSNPVEPSQHTVLAWPAIILLAITLCYYLYVTYRYWPNVVSQVRATTSVSKTLLAHQFRSNEQISFEQHGSALLLLSLLVATLSFLPTQGGEHNLLILPVVVALLLSLHLYKRLVLMVITPFCNNPAAISNLLVIDRHYRSTIGLLLTPIAIIVVTNSQDSSPIIITLIAIWILYIFRILTTFIMNGFGKLQWFLYLCIVEIVPITLIWALSMRY